MEKVKKQEKLKKNVCFDLIYGCKRLQVIHTVKSK